ncbi:hypothetical protein ACLMJK_006934 [Lecanora helva]
MESSEDKQWASKYLLDPLNAPQPADETGPGTHYNSTFAASASSTSSPSGHKKKPSVSTRSTDAPPKQQQTPTGSTTRSSNNPYRNIANGSTGSPSAPQSAKDRSSPHSSAFPDFDGSYSPIRRSTDQASSQIPTSTGGQNSSSTTASGHRRRTSSLNQRFPGDQTHRPLDMLRKDTKAADRSPHLRKKNQIGADSVDRLDNLIAGAYHHEGPYDATLLARNTSYTNSPIEAVSTGNEEALKATPREMIKDSVEKHRPLDGVAMVPPGAADQFGNTYHYNEGSDLMIEGDPPGGAYKRWPGVKYLPEDLKGKGEPSYSLEKALKEHKLHDKHIENGGQGIEMVSPAERRRPLSVDGEARREGVAGLKREDSGEGKLRKRFGSLKVKGHRASGSR